MVSIAGRYEAGVGTLNKNKEENGTEDEKNNPFDYSVTFNDGESLFNSVKIQTGINNTNWQNYNFTARRIGTPVTTESNKAIGNVTVKADSIPYYHADYYTAVEMSRRLYANHNYVKSGLLTGTMWDMIMRYMRDIGNVDILSSTCGNYDNVSLTDLSGYYTNVVAETKNGKILGETDGFKKCDNNMTTNNGIASFILLTTGSTEQVKKMNLYDVAGNLWEWTQESSYMANFNYNMNETYNTYTIRGGSFGDAYTTYPDCSRACEYAPSCATPIGFRPALFLQ